MPEEMHDGRRARSVRSREKIRQALWDLMHTGVLIPSAQQISEQAGVGLRTVFRHFDDMESLFNTMNDGLRSAEADTLDNSVIEGPLDERLDALLSVRHQLYHKYEKVILFTLAQTWKYKALKENYASLNYAFKSYLFKSLPELETMPEDRQQFVEALVSFEMWHRLTHHQNMDRVAVFSLVKKQALSVLETNPA